MIVRMKLTAPDGLCWEFIQVLDKMHKFGPG